MQPKPSSDTSKPFVPRMRFFMMDLLIITNVGFNVLQGRQIDPPGTTLRLLINARPVPEGAVVEVGEAAGNHPRFRQYEGHEIVLLRIEARPFGLPRCQLRDIREI